MNGFHFILQDYCQYCKDFNPELEQVNITNWEDKSERYMNNVSCSNKCRCEQLMERLKNKTVD